MSYVRNPVLTVKDLILILQSMPQDSNVIAVVDGSHAGEALHVANMEDGTIEIYAEREE
jgi:hypothetical protein